MTNMQISKNHFNRFDIENIVDVGIKKDGKTVEGVTGYHGPLANIIGWILEKIFHKTVAISGNDGVYYLNCQSLANFFNRMDSKKYVDLKDLASKAHDPVWVETTIKKVAEVTREKVKSHEEMLAAIRDQNVLKCQDLLKAGVSPKPYGSKEAPLNVAVQSNLIPSYSTRNIIDLLIDKGADVNGRDSKGILPLEVALKNKDFQTCEILILKGADGTLKPSDCSSFIELVEKTFTDPSEKETLEGLKKFFTPENLANVKKELEQEKVNEVQRKEQEEQRKIADKFHQAVVNADVKECKELIATGFKPSMENFIVAISSHHRDQNQFDLLDLLLQQPGIGVNVRDRGGHLPLEYPIEKFNPEILEWLINKGADITQKPARFASLFDLAKDKMPHSGGWYADHRVKIFTLLGHADKLEQEKKPK